MEVSDGRIEEEAASRAIWGRVPVSKLTRTPNAFRLPKTHSCAYLILNEQQMTFVVIIKARSCPRIRYLQK